MRHDDVELSLEEWAEALRLEFFDIVAVEDSVIVLHTMSNGDTVILERIS